MSTLENLREKLLNKEFTVKEIVKELEDKYPAPSMSLNLSSLEAIVVHELLMNIKLGDRNKWETAISNLVIKLESSEHYTFIEALQAKYGRPSIFKEDEDDEYGISIRLEE